MNELRWILLVAGALLIAGLYLWGMRSRWQGRGETEASRRPAVFTGGAQGFETAVASELVDDDGDGAGQPDFRVETRAERRIEPSFDDDSVDASEATSARRVEFDDEGDFETPAIGRREPTLASTRSETATISRLEPTLRVEPTLDVHPIEASEPPPAALPAATPVPRRAQKIRAARHGVRSRALRRRPVARGAWHRGAGLRPLRDLPPVARRWPTDLQRRQPARAGHVRHRDDADDLLPRCRHVCGAAWPVSAADAFDEMIFAARAMATHLNGSLADERGAPLTALRVGKLREEALEFERGAGSS